MERKLLKLRGRIIEVFGTYAHFAAAAGISGASVSAKLKRGTFTSQQIRRWADLLKIADSEIADYFLE